MASSQDLTSILAKLLETALLRVRAFAWSGRADRAAIESDHVHNLPGMSVAPMPEVLDYQGNMETPAYLEPIPETEARDWEPLWEVTRRLYRSQVKPSVG